MLPQIRPLQIEKAVRLAIENCQINEFCWNQLEKSNKCPVLIYQLYKRGVFLFEKIEPYLYGRDTFLLSIYFLKDINDYRSFIEFKYKHLLLQGFVINDKVTSMVVCSSCIDLYHICQGVKSLSAEEISMESEFCHLS